MLPVLYAFVAIGVWFILVCLIDGRDRISPLLLGLPLTADACAAGNE